MLCSVGEGQTLRWGRSNPPLGETRTPVREQRPSQQGTTPVPPAHIVSAVWGSGTANFIFVSAILENVSATFRSSPPRKRRQSPSRCRSLPPNGTTSTANPTMKAFMVGFIVGLALLYFFAFRFFGLPFLALWGGFMAIQARKSAQISSSAFTPRPFGALPLSQGESLSQSSPSKMRGWP